MSGLNCCGQAPIITYNSPNTFKVGETITDLKPAVTGFGAGTTYSINQALPAGLNFDKNSGIINGTPNLVSPPTFYIITATNGTITSSFPVNINISISSDVINTPPTIEFVGQGNIQPSLSSGSKIPATTGIGVIYTEDLKRNYGMLHSIRIEFSVNVASTVDTIKSINDAMNNVTNIRDYGNSVLLPINSGQAFSFNFTGYLTENQDKNWNRNVPPKALLGIISGFNISFVGSNRNWEYDLINADKSTTPTLVKTSLISLYAGVFQEIVPFNYRPNNSITIGVGYTGRFIAGDIAQTTESKLRDKLLGSTNNSFSGIELSLGLRFSNIKAEVRVPFLSPKSNIPGLTGVQPITLITFTGGFPIKLTSK